MSPGRRPRPGPLVITLLVLAVLIGLAVFGSMAWTEFLWYQSVGYSDVLVREVLTKVGLFLAGLAICAAVVASSMLIGYRTAPVYAPSTSTQQALDHYRAALDPLRRVATIVVPIILGLLAGGAAASQWQTFLLFLNRQSFGTTDRTFGMDIGFFVFTMPWLAFLESFATMVLVLALIAALFTHYVYGGLQLTGKGPRTTRAAGTHLGILAALFLLVRAAGYWLDRYQLTVKDGGRITGLTYTDANAVLQTKQILAVAAVIVALLFLLMIRKNSWRVPLIGVAALAVVTVVVGTVTPALVQSLKVRPSEQSLEAPYIQRNIEATRAAYGLDEVATQNYEATKETSPAQLRAAAGAIPGIRIVDPLIVSSTFKTVQAPKQYYAMPSILDVDRYALTKAGAGVTTSAGASSAAPATATTDQDAVVAVRELDVAGIPATVRNWVNEHTVYTHGYGFIAAYGTEKEQDGRPRFFSYGLPQSGLLGTFEPRIYFGENSPLYSIVGATPGAAPAEVDYESTKEVRNTYAGGGGVAMDNVFKRAAYALNYRELKIMLSDQVGDYSRMLDHRSPKERVERVAPWMTVDGNPYPAVVDGRIQWIVDGYTTSSSYPYSQMESLGTATTDAVTTRARNVTAADGGEVNYIRNSVKATVDAYDGSVKLYGWDDKDPVLKAWSGAFPGTIRPMSEISGQLMSHLRYPEDLFKVQREVLTRYHVTDPGAFFGGADYWKVPDDPTDADVRSQPPYYLSVQMPGQDKARFSLTTSFLPNGSESKFLTGFLGVDSDAGSTPGQRAPGYGKLRLLTVNSDRQINGPAQVQNQVNASNVTSSEYGSQALNNYLNISNQNGSRVSRGNLLSLPLAGGILNVQPIYVSGVGSSSYQQLTAVVTTFGDQLAWGKTVQSALGQLFSSANTSSPAPGTPGTNGTPGSTTAPTPSGTASSPAPTIAGDTLAKAIADAQDAYAAGQAAQQKGDWAAYGEAQKKLGAALARATALAPQGGRIDLTPSSSATSTPSGSSSAQG